MIIRLYPLRDTFDNTYVLSLCYRLPSFPDIVNMVIADWQCQVVSRVECFLVADNVILQPDFNQSSEDQNYMYNNLHLQTLF